MLTIPYPPGFLTLVQGFLLCASLIIAIGPQNLFLLQQGVRRRHLFVTALLCTLFDLVLIAVGVGGLGTVIAANQRLLTATTLGGSAVLLGYGVRALRSAWCSPPAAAPQELIDKPYKSRTFVQERKAGHLCDFYGFYL